MSILLTGRAVIRNAIKYDFPVNECIASCIDACDEFILFLCDSEDDTPLLCQQLAETYDNLRVVERPWSRCPEETREGANLGNMLREAMDMAAGRWILHMDADEVLPEGEDARLREAVEAADSMEDIIGVSVVFHHLWGSYDWEAVDWLYPAAIRVARRDPRIWPGTDAPGFRCESPDLVYDSDVHVVHYGATRLPEVYLAKEIAFQDGYHGSHDGHLDVARNDPRTVYPLFTDRFRLVRFHGRHHPAMLARCRGHFLDRDHARWRLGAEATPGSAPPSPTSEPVPGEASARAPQFTLPPDPMARRLPHCEPDGLPDLIVQDLGSGLGAERMAALVDSGADATLMGVHWGQIEPTEGAATWDTYDRYVEAAQSAGMSLIARVPFMIVPPWAKRKYDLPFRSHTRRSNFEGHVGNDLPSFWHPYGLEKTQEIVETFADRYAGIAAIVGSSPAVGAGGEIGYCTLFLEGDHEASHSLWCFDSYAQADFRLAMRDAHGSLAALNARFGTDFATWDDVMPAQSFREGLHFMDSLVWYAGALARYVDWLMELHSRFWRRLWLAHVPWPGLAELYMAAGSPESPEMMSRLAGKYSAAGVEVLHILHSLFPKDEIDSAYANWSMLRHGWKTWVGAEGAANAPDSARRALEIGHRGLISWPPQSPPPDHDETAGDWQALAEGCRYLREHRSRLWELGETPGP